MSRRAVELMWEKRFFDLVALVKSCSWFDDREVFYKNIARNLKRVMVQLMRVVNEAVINVIRHAHATKVTFSYKVTDAGLSMTIADDVASVFFDFVRQAPYESASLGDSQDVALLTEHEKQLIRLVAMGYSNRDIGKRLFVGEGTVKKQVSNLLAKLGLENRVQAAVYALRSGLAE